MSDFILSLPSSRETPSEATPAFGEGVEDGDDLT